MLQGLFKVEFQTPLGAGAGVVFLSDGKIRGGDSMMSYVGDFKQNGDDFSATVEGRVHTNQPGMSTVFGVNHTHITLAGKTKGDSAVIQGTAREAPHVPFQARLSKITD